MNDPKRILIVDDDLLSIASISQTLLRGGYQTIHATNRRGALRAILHDRPDLVICNLDGRKFNARQLLQSVKQDRESRGIPFLFLVESHLHPNPAPEILGPKQYLKKPFTREQLTSAIRDHLGDRKQPEASG
jgi:CheY-like chemotaxis protein